MSPEERTWIPVFDGHNDALTWIVLAGQEGERLFLEGHDDWDIDLPKARSGGLAGGLFAIFVPAQGFETEWLMPQQTDDGYRTLPQPAVDQAYAWDQTLFGLTRTLRLIRNAPDRLVLASDAQQLASALGSERVVVVLHLEGAEALDHRLELLDVLVALGVRSLGIAWSRANRFATGVPFCFPSTPDIGTGLTAPGIDLIRRCNEIGVMIDLAHINERGFWDVAGLSSAPLVVSHANAHAICPSSRNLTDAQIDAVGRSGGLIGVNFNCRDLRPDGRDDPDTPLDVIVRHVEYLAGRVGIDHVAFGSDLAGARMPAPLGGAAGFGALLERFGDRGFADSDLCKLAHGNWLRVLTESWRPSATAPESRREN